MPDAAATREKEGINVEAAVFDDDEEAIREGEGLYRRVRPVDGSPRLLGYVTSRDRHREERD